MIITGGILKMRKPKMVNTYEDRKPVLYDAKQIKEIFHLDSIASARRLMNNPGFPSMRVGRKLLVTDYQLELFLTGNDTGYVDLY